MTPTFLWSATFSTLWPPPTRDVVLTDRTDVLEVKKLRSEFWVCGTFIVRDSLIAKWDDHFSLGSLVKGLVLGTAKALRTR